jgi:hypothetical protein
VDIAAAETSRLQCRGVRSELEALRRSFRPESYLTLERNSSDLSPLKLVVVVRGRGVRLVVAKTRYRSAMRSARFRAAGAFVGLILASSGATTSSEAYTAEPPPRAICGSDSQAALAVLEAGLTPPNGATALAGEPVTFSGHSEAPTNFVVASSTPGNVLDEGLGSLLAGPEPGAQPIYTYSFTSTKATAAPGTIYWHASFSNATLTPCVGLSASVLQTTTRALNVLPAPPSAPPPEPSAPPREPSPPVAAPHLQARIASAGGFHTKHPIVALRVRCSMTCSGNAYVQAFVVRPDATTRRLSRLDFGPVSVAIPSAGGGSELLTHRYRGRGLRVLDRILRGGAVIEIKLTARVTAASGETAMAHSTTWLRS